MTSSSSKHPSAHVTEARAAAQRAKLDAQVERRAAEKKTATKAKGATGKDKQAALLLKRHASTTVEGAIADYLLDHEGGNSSQKTLQWHQTALGLLCRFLREERDYAGGGSGRLRYQRLVCLHAQNPVQSWQG